MRREIDSGNVQNENDLEIKSFHQMTRKELLVRAEAELLALGRQRRAQRLAREVMRTLHLFPEGIDLVVWLAGGQHRSNADAITAWIDRELERDGSGSDDHAEVSTLCERLIRRLQVIAESFAC